MHKLPILVSIYKAYSDLLWFSEYIDTHNA